MAETRSCFLHGDYTGKDECSKCKARRKPKDGVVLPSTVFDVRAYEAGPRPDWNADVPNEVQRELMEVATRTGMSFDYLCAIYRKGFTDAHAAGYVELEHPAETALRRLTGRVKRHGEASSQCACDGPTRRDPSCQIHSK